MVATQVDAIHERLPLPSAPAPERSLIDPITPVGRALWPGPDAAGWQRSLAAVRDMVGGRPLWPAVWSATASGWAVPALRAAVSRACEEVDAEAHVPEQDARRLLVQLDRLGPAAMLSSPDVATDPLRAVVERMRAAGGEWDAFTGALAAAMPIERWENALRRTSRQLGGQFTRDRRQILLSALVSSAMALVVVVACAAPEKLDSVDAALRESTLRCLGLIAS